MSSITDQGERNALVDAILAEVEGLSQRDAADRLARYGFSHSTIGGWRRLREDGEDVPMPRGDVRKGLLSFAQQATHNGSGRQEETPEEAMAQSEEDQLVELLMNTVRMAGGTSDFTPEERRRVQLDVLEGIIRLHQADGRDVQRLVELRKSLQEGETPGEVAKEAPPSHASVWMVLDRESRSAEDRARAAVIEAEAARERAVAARIAEENARALRAGLPYEIREATEDERRRHEAVQRSREEEEEERRRAS